MRLANRYGFGALVTETVVEPRADDAETALLEIFPREPNHLASQL